MFLFVFFLSLDCVFGCLGFILFFLVTFYQKSTIFSPSLSLSLSLSVCVCVCVCANLTQTRRVRVWLRLRQCSPSCLVPMPSSCMFCVPISSRSVDVGFVFFSVRGVFFVRSLIGMVSRKQGNPFLSGTVANSQNNPSKFGRGGQCNLNLYF